MIVLTILYAAVATTAIEEAHQLRLETSANVAGLPEGFEMVAGKTEALTLSGEQNRQLSEAGISSDHLPHREQFRYKRDNEWCYGWRYPSLYWNTCGIYNYGYGGCGCNSWLGGFFYC